ncbi:prepilin-type N-terminal cleavage/methylation domain-containing protein [Amycolatopsis japonica]|uniref:prepilin-type N-terminal cleavage/methylation domain-containing protein n=1 Tax=Amycolatopsis japonica TaxID=208439 RepID=UPI003795745D
MLSRRRARDDAGFTLIELLIVISLLGVIAAPLAAVVIVSIRSTDETSARLVLSHDAQQSAAFFAQDVAAFGSRDYSGQVANGTVPFFPSLQLGAAYDDGGHTCGTAATPVSLLRLLSDDWDTSGPNPVRRTAVVAYYLTSSGELHRMKCEGTPAPVSDVVLAHHADPATAVVTCSSTCTATPVPQKVKLSFTVVTDSAEPYVITLEGQRRQT